MGRRAQATKHWTQHRLVEPSTHTAIAVWLLAGVVFAEAATMESSGWTTAIALWAGVHALLGVVLREGRGL
jgi:hypothetical protein